MKTLLITCVFGFWMGTTTAQTGEFKVYENNLIYPPQTIAALQKKADLINEKFNKCTPKDYYSVPQTIGIALTLEQPLKQQSLSFINELSELRQIVPIKHENAVALLKIDLDNNGEKYYTVSPIAVQIAQLYDYKRMDEKWLVAINENQEIQKLIYIPDGFQSTLLPATYASDISYVDCMVDTNTSKMLDNAKEGSANLPANWRDRSQKQKEALLKQLRSTIVYGYCSMDESPRVHAKNIALVAAEVGNWEVFLQAHLDIMMDNMERMSDANYAWGRRLTYIKELEQMNIHLPNFLIGTALLADNLADGHYFGRINRLGRAIAESKDLSQFLERLEDGMTDPQLDLTNKVRLLIVYLNTANTLDNEMSTEMIAKAEEIKKKLQAEIQIK